MNMDIFLYNLSWMIFNLSLAILPVLFSFFLFRKTNKVLRAVMFVLWFLFLPNTIYVLTDLSHLIEDWGYFEGVGKVVLLLQYAIFEIIGLTCFLIAFTPWEKIFQRFLRSDKRIVFGLITVNFLMGLAMVLGRVERLHSWYVFTQPQHVINSTINVLTSYELFGLIILLGLFSNFFYFLFRERAKMLYLKWGR